MAIIVDMTPAAGTSVELHALWFNNATNPADLRELAFVGSYSLSSSVNGEVRVGASGRERAFTKAGKPCAAQIVLQQCSREDIAWLEDHRGVLLCVRDDRGRKWYGIYFEVPVEESVDWSDRGDVTLQLKSVSFSEAI